LNKNGEIDLFNFYVVEGFMMKSFSKKALFSLVVMMVLGMTSQMVRAESALYWTEMDTNRIFKSTLQGTLTEMVRGVRNGTVLHIAVDPTTGKRYWTGLDLPPHRGGWSYGVVRSSDADGTNERMIVGDFWARDSRPMDVALDVSAGKMYWTDMGWPNPGIHRANLDGSFPEMLVDIRALQLTVNHGAGVGQTREFGLTYNLALDLQNGKMCWTDYMANDIHCSDLNGGGITRVAFGLRGTPRGIDIDPATETIYWVTGTGGEVMRKEVGLSPESIVNIDLGTDLDMPMDIATDGQHLYFTDKAAGVIYRSNMDGTGVIVLNLRQYDRVRPGKKTKTISLDPLGIALAIEPPAPTPAPPAPTPAPPAPTPAPPAPTPAPPAPGTLSVPRSPSVSYKVNKKGYGTWNISIAASTSGLPTSYRLVIVDPAKPENKLYFLNITGSTDGLMAAKIKGLSFTNQGLPEGVAYLAFTETPAGVRSAVVNISMRSKL